jgi:hypothetical protein
MKAKYADTFQNIEGETVHRLVLDIPGHDVQILQFDSSPCVCVKVDDDMVMMQIGEIDKYIAARVGAVA